MIAAFYNPHNIRCGDTNQRGFLGSIIAVVGLAYVAFYYYGYERGYEDAIKGDPHKNTGILFKINLVTQ